MARQTALVRLIIWLSDGSLVVHCCTVCAPHFKYHAVQALVEGRHGTAYTNIVKSKRTGNSML